MGALFKTQDETTSIVSHDIISYNLMNENCIIGKYIVLNILNMKFKHIKTYVALY